MRRLYLEAPNTYHKSLYEAMMDEWEAFGGRLNPGALNRNGASYETWLGWIEADRHYETCPPGSVPQDLLFLMEAHADDLRLVGAVTIRKALAHRLGHNGSSFGFGVRPTCRGRGYGRQLLALAIEKATEDYGLHTFLLTCDSDNAASIRVIEHCGGVLQDEIITPSNRPMLRYRIDR